MEEVIKANEKDRPIIGIVAKPRSSKHGWNLMYCSDHIKDAIVNNGGLAIGILPQGKALDFYEDIKNYDYKLDDEERQRFYRILDMCDGIVLEGGLTRAEYEVEVAKYAYEKDVPILGICSGQSNQIKALGGDNKLLETNKDFHNNYDDKYVHKVRLNKNSKLYSIIGKEEIDVNSVHENIPYKTGMYEVCGFSEDGLYEATEIKDRLFNIGVRFHPELLFKQDKYMNNIFEALIKTSVIYKSRKNQIKLS